IWLLRFKEQWDPMSLPNPMDKTPDPEWLVALLGSLDLGIDAEQFLRGVGLWTNELAVTGLGLVLGFCQLMVLLAIAVALATRLPMLVNLVIFLVVFFLGHLAPILMAVSQKRYALVQFTARVFDTVLPGLEFYDTGPVVVRDAPLPQGEFALYVLSVTGYSVL